MVTEIHSRDQHDVYPISQVNNLHKQPVWPKIVSRETVIAAAVEKPVPGEWLDEKTGQRTESRKLDRGLGEKAKERLIFILKRKAHSVDNSPVHMTFILWQQALSSLDSKLAQ